MKILWALVSYIVIVVAIWNLPFQNFLLALVGLGSLYIAALSM